MSQVNHLYNLLWEYLEFKIVEKFEDQDNVLVSTCDYRKFLTTELFEGSGFYEWVNEAWTNAGLDEDNILTMSDTIDIIKYISRYKWFVYEGGFDKPDDFIQHLTPSEMFNHYVIACLYFDSSINNHITNIITNMKQDTVNPNKRKRDDNDEAVPIKSTKRKRDDNDEVNDEAVPIKSTKRKRDDNDEVNDEAVVKKIKVEHTYKDELVFKFAEKMNNDSSFREWVDMRKCFRTYVTRPTQLLKMPGRIQRDTNEPMIDKLVRACIKHDHSFEQVVTRFEYDMSRVDLNSVKTRLGMHYPNESESVLDVLAHECISKLVHPDDYDFNKVEDVDEWNSRLDLIPNTPKKRRRSERLIGARDRKRLL